MDSQNLLRSLQMDVPRTALEDRFEQRCHAVSCGGSIVLARVLDCYLMYLDMEDSSVAANLAMRGYWEFWITRAMVQQLWGKIEGRYVIDAGANAGYYTLLLSDMVGPRGHVTAFEPYRPVFEQLVRTQDLNGLRGRVDTLLAALWEKTGRAGMQTFHHDFGVTQVSDRFTEDEQDDECMVFSLDDYMQQEPSLRFIKIDCEGSEPHIWAGMQKVVERSPELEILMEFTPCAYDDAKGFEADLRKRFRIFDVGVDSKLTPAPDNIVDSTPEYRMIWLRPK